MNKRYVAYVLTVVAALGSMGPAAAGDVVLGGRIVEVANTNGSPGFNVRVSGGSLNLCGSGWIVFPASAAPDAESHKRAYAAALVALTTGALVRLHNYQGNTCDTVSFIQLSAP